MTTALCGLSNGTTYTCTVAVDGGTPQAVSWDPPVSSTFQDLLDEFNSQIEGALADTDSDGNIIVTSRSSGSASSIAIVDTDFFSSTTGYSALASAVAGTGTQMVYNLAITGGSLTITNNITFLTPEELGVVNQSIGSFTGTRAVSGNVTAYLRTGSANTGGLLADMVSATDTVTHNFDMVMAIGGAAHTPRVELSMKHAHLVIPAVSIEDVISVNIGFTALGQDISQKDELEIKYIAQ